jgi:hypothetical protein
MSLRDMVAEDSTAIIEDDDDFASPIVLIAPDTTRYDLRGIYNRVGVMIDPNSGLKIFGNSSSITVSLSTLISLGVTIEALDTENWQVEAEDINGEKVVGYISAALKDRTLGRATMAIRTVPQNE